MTTTAAPHLHHSVPLEVTLCNSGNGPDKEGVDSLLLTHKAPFLAVPPPEATHTTHS